ncbi:MAG TPA: rod shape-determining protein [Verrucomicrobiae bacterium]|nr:rod shape-determining protein [Verrucomicrobiae bacterium]
MNPPTVANHIVNAVLNHVRNNKDPLLATAFAAPKNPFAVQTPTHEFSGNGADLPIDTESEPSILLVGVDWGASKTCIKAAFAGSDGLAIDECIPTVLGYAKDGIIDGVLPDNATTLFGREALTHRRHLHLTCPTINSAAAADFARHLRSRLDNIPNSEIRAVIAVPATFDAVLRNNLRQTISEHFQSAILLPQSYLAAIGYRDESRLLDPHYIDPVRNSIFIDIGASSTNLCLVQGYYLTAEEQLTLNFGGQNIDELLRVAILENHPDAELSPITVRHIKEQHAFAGAAANPLPVDIVVAGKTRTLDLSSEITASINELLIRLVDSLKTLLMTVDSDAATELLQNIILTGGGSRIKNIAPELQSLLASEGFADPHVETVGPAYKDLTATGALKAAGQARVHHWLQVAN